VLNLKRVNLKLARQWKREAVTRLRQRKDVNGRRLAPKKFPNGRPLGFGKSSGGIPSRIRRARVRALHTGFNVTIRGRTIGDTVFDKGRAGQVRRRYAGISQRQQKAYARVVVQAIVAEGRKMRLWR